MPRGIYKRKLKPKIREIIQPAEVVGSVSTIDLLGSEPALKREAIRAIEYDQWAVAEAIIAVLRSKRQLSDAETTLQVKLQGWQPTRQ